MIGTLGSEKVIKADFVQCGAGSISGDMSADAAALPIGAHYHGHGIPTNDALDAPLYFATARKRRLAFNGDGSYNFV